MKVLHLETGRALYGGAKQVQFLLQGLSQHGVESVLCCPKGSAIGHAAQSIGVDIHFTDSAGDLDLKFYRDFKNILKVAKPDIVHLHSRRGADVLGAIAVKRENIPCVLSRRVDNPENRLLLPFKYSLFDKVICISEGIKAVLKSQGVDERKLTCVRSAVVAKDFQQPTSRVNFLKRFSLHDDNLHIGVIAQLIKRKGHAYLIEAAKSLVENTPNLKFIFFGQGREEGNLKRAIAQAGLESHFQFAGFVDDLHLFLGHLDIVAHPAEMEGLGVALLQSSAAQVPIVASKAGGIPEIVRHEENGFLITPKHVGELRAALQRLIEQPELRRQFGKNGKSLVEREFSVEVMVKGNAEVYGALLSSAKARL